MGSIISSSGHGRIIKIFDDYGSLHRRHVDKIRIINNYLINYNNDFFIKIILI